MEIKITEPAVEQIRIRKAKIKDDCVPVITYFQPDHDSVYPEDHEKHKMDFVVVRNGYWGLGWRLRHQTETNHIEIVHGLEIVFDQKNSKPPGATVFIDYTDKDFQVSFK